MEDTAFFEEAIPCVENLSKRICDLVRETSIAV
jgi:hypothetical protein